MAKNGPTGVFVDLKCLMPWNRRLIKLLSKFDYSVFGSKLINANLNTLASFKKFNRVQNDLYTFLTNNKIYELKLVNAKLAAMEDVMVQFEIYKELFECITEYSDIDRNKAEYKKVFRNMFGLIAKVDRSLSRWRGNLSKKVTFTTKSAGEPVAIQAIK